MTYLIHMLQSMINGEGAIVEDIELKIGRTMNFASGLTVNTQLG